MQSDFDEKLLRVNRDMSSMKPLDSVGATRWNSAQRLQKDVMTKIGDVQEALRYHDSWMEDVSKTLQQMQEKEENLTEYRINLKNEMNAKLDTKGDSVALWTVRDMVSSLRFDVDARRRKVDEILTTIRLDITAVETNLEESKAKITSDTDQAVNALNGRIDSTNKDLVATQDSLHTTQNSLSDRLNEVAVVRSDLEH